MSYSGKVVIVTGASSGIGAATAVRFAEQGASVVLVGRNTVKLAGVEASCAALGPTPLVVAADVSSDNDAERIIGDTIKRFGKLDILVNNAGIFTIGGVLSGSCLEDYDRVMATNVRAVIKLTHLAAPHLIETKGNIINISSIAAIKVYPMLAYCASKAALDHVTRCMALELAPKGVRVNGINPGPVRTDIVENCLGLSKEEAQAQFDQSLFETPLKRISESEEVADVVLFLANAPGITGSNYVIDNGVLLSNKIQ